MKLAVIHASWIAHCKSSYPREFAHPKRLPSAIRDDDVLVGTIGRWSKKNQPCYISVYAFSNWTHRPDSAIIDRVYIDLDHHTNPQSAIEDAIKLIEGLERHGIQTTQYFSGKKGIAVYIDFPPVQIQPENKKDTVSAFQHAIIKRFNLRFDTDGGTVDRHPIGDINRVSRLPNTKHQKSGLYCIPVMVDELREGIDHIRELAQKPRALPIEIHDNTAMPDYLYRIEQQVIKEYEIRKIINGVGRLQRQYQPHKFGGKSKNENVANKLIAELETTGDLLHNRRVGLVCLLHDLDWSRGEIVSLFMSNLSGANQKKTEDQVNSVIQGKRGRAR